MRKVTAARIAIIAVLTSAGVLAAHHSLIYTFDTTAPVWVKGTLVRLELVNPHSIMFLDQTGKDGKVQRWAVDGGPTPAQLDRRDIDADTVKVGDVIEVCGFVTKEGVSSQRTFPPPGNQNIVSSAPSMSGRLMNGTLLVLTDGQTRVWSDYGGLQKCLEEEQSLRNK